MAGSYTTLGASEMRAFLSHQGQRRTGPHRMTKRILHWQFCATCGLLALKNEVSRRALRAPCMWEED